MGVAIFYGDAWSGLRPALERMGFVWKPLDVPISAKFLSEIGILVIPGCGQAGDKQFTKEEVELIREFVKAGGGLLCAAQAWSWVYKEYGNKPIELFPINAIGREMGFSITGKNIGRPDSATAEKELFGLITNWNVGDWWPSQVQPLKDDVITILRDSTGRSVAVSGEVGRGRFVVAGHEGLFEYVPEAFKAVLSLLMPRQ